MMRKVRKSLPDINIPALVIQAKNDPKVAPQSGPAIFNLLRTEKNISPGLIIICMELFAAKSPAMFLKKLSRS